MTRPADVPAPPIDDADLPRFLAELALPGIIDGHLHFLPERMLRKVWAYFDEAPRHYGVSWPIHYRSAERFDPRDPLLRPAWGLLAEAGVPAVVHCGDGPIPGRYTGLDVFGEVLAEHPRLPVVLAHAGMPDFAGALELVDRFPHVLLDTATVGTSFTERLAPLPVDWPAPLAAVRGRVVFGSDFPNIPYPYSEQVSAVTRWAGAGERLGADFVRSVLYDAPARLLVF